VSSIKKNKEIPDLKAISLFLYCVIGEKSCCLRLPYLTAFRFHKEKFASITKNYHDRFFTISIDKPVITGMMML